MAADQVSGQEAKSRVTKSRLLVAEGGHDAAFFCGMHRNLGIEGVQVNDCGGKKELPKYIRLLAYQSMFVKGEMEALAITRDADGTEMGENEEVRDVSGTVASAFDSVARALRESKLPSPDEPGTITGTCPRVGVFILPNNRDSGCLESLCIKAIADRPEMECVEGYFHCAKEKGCPEPHSMPKSILQAWLALQPGRDLYLSRAVHQGFWPWDHDAFAELKGFLRELFAHPLA